MTTNTSSNPVEGTAGEAASEAYTLSDMIAGEFTLTARCEFCNKDINADDFLSHYTSVECQRATRECYKAQDKEGVARLHLLDNGAIVETWLEPTYYVTPGENDTVTETDVYEYPKHAPAPAPGSNVFSFSEAQASQAANLAQKLEDKSKSVPAPNTNLQENREKATQDKKRKNAGTAVPATKETAAKDSFLPQPVLETQSTSKTGETAQIQKTSPSNVLVTAKMGVTTENEAERSKQTKPASLEIQPPKETNTQPTKQNSAPPEPVSVMEITTQQTKQDAALPNSVATTESKTEETKQAKSTSEPPPSKDNKRPAESEPKEPEKRAKTSVEKEPVTVSTIHPIPEGVIRNMRLSTLLPAKKDVVSLFKECAEPHVKAFYKEWAISAAERGRVQTLADYCVSVLKRTRGDFKLDCMVMITGSHRLGTQLKGHSDVDIIVYTPEPTPERVEVFAQAFRIRWEREGKHCLGLFEDHTLGFMVGTREGACAAILFVAAASPMRQLKLDQAGHRTLLENGLDSIAHASWFYALPEAQRGLTAQCTLVLKALVAIEQQQNRALAGNNIQSNIPSIPAEAGKPSSLPSSAVGAYLGMVGPWRWLALSHHACFVSGKPHPQNLSWALRYVFECLASGALTSGDITDPCRPNKTLGTGLNAATKEYVCAWAQNKLRLIAFGLWGKVFPLAGGQGQDSTVLGTGRAGDAQPISGLEESENARRLVEDGFRMLPLHPVAY